MATRFFARCCLTGGRVLSVHSPRVVQQHSESQYETDNPEVGKEPVIYAVTISRATTIASGEINCTLCSISSR
jgi:hypothetical protein